MRVTEWRCDNTAGGFRHRWSVPYGLVPMICPFCAAPNREEIARVAWKQSALFKWAKRKTNGR